MNAGFTAVMIEVAAVSCAGAGPMTSTGQSSSLGCRELPGIRAEGL